MYKKGLHFAVLLTLYLFCGNTVVAAKFLVPFDLPAGPLSEALIQFAKQSDVSLLVSKTAVSKLSVNNIKGVMTLTQALDRLLENSGLTYQFIDRNTVSVSIAPSLLASNPEPNGAGDKIGLPTETSYTIEEITVTAGRRTENLQKVPIAVSVLNDMSLQVSDIRNLTDIASRAPGLTVSSFSLGQPSIHMRGIGSNDDGAAMDSSVVVFLDDVYVGRISTIDLNVLDLQQVEILRGPQGTLYGKNAIGGAIKLISKNPSDEPEARLKLTAGNYRAGGLNFLANGPLSQHWQGRISLDTRRQDGWQENLVLGGEKQHDGESWGIRSQLRNTASDTTNAQWSVDFSGDNRNSTGRIPVRGGVPIHLLDSSGNRIPQMDSAGNPLLDTNGQTLYATALPTTIFQQLGGSPRHATNDQKGFTDRKIWGLNQRISHATSKGSWISITGYRDSDFAWFEDSIGIPSFVSDQGVTTFVNEAHKQFSQEIRWTSDLDASSSTEITHDKSLSYVLGMYYLYEQTDRLEEFAFSDTSARTNQSNQTNSYAILGQLDYQVTPHTTLTLGGRYNRDTKNLSQESFNGGAPAIILESFQLRSRETWQDFSPRLALSYTPNDDQLFYGAISRGMKSGGFQGAPSTLAVAQRIIDPESAVAYELGFKSQWLEDRLRLNLAAFYTDYQDLQVVQFQTIDNFGQFQTDNAASATLQGLEFEFDAYLSSALTLSGSYAYLDATYDSFDDLDGRDFTGNHLRQAPKHTATLALHYEIPLPRGSLHLNADYRYQSKSFREPDNSITQQPAYQLVDTSLSYRASNNRWEAKLWAKNALDELYIAHLYVLGGNDYANFGTPRTYGITLSMNYQ